MSTISEAERQAIAYLLSPQSVRDRCGQLFELARKDKLAHFRLNLSQLPFAADYVLAVMRQNYPDLQVPFHSRWRHFNAGGSDRLAELDQRLASLNPLEQARARFDLVIPSVLLDAGAGANWRYQEAETGQVSQRSEGLAIASFRMFCAGAFSSVPAAPLQTDSEALLNLDASALRDGFQVTDANPLVGLEGRLQLMCRLGQVLRDHPQYFGAENPRPGYLVDYLLKQSVDQQLPAPKVLSAVLQSLGNIWPGRIQLSGINLGDVWSHSALTGDQLADGGLVPFHKLSQWLTYSLLEPLQTLGITITQLDQLTGLAEYRNGGLCIDTGLLEPKHEAVTKEAHLPSSEIIVEWRAVTVILLDKIADAIRQSLNLSEIDLPLVKVLEGGTWAAGRQIAAEKRMGGGPPIQIESDGTVF
ncbi:MULTISPECIES: URC4/urg3 family protein [unclassified Leptolyngbya]|uniref:URC4/urg3 family protein n=1 Tax=unclassified Leptolyngbya TaxID=2650499 RepID=UPI001688CA38|nr:MULTISPECIES: URC4/urg3 family protein [unclassified Leptolyngbya]MBD1909649.1 URC4/urg3 family protein [Leptolyngbya sp. FACHB-8]MBD2157574.1 URC4/urg3 family protein [Leptolyngbya sp. FACHB-16]